MIKNLKALLLILFVFHVWTGSALSPGPERDIRPDRDRPRPWLFRLASRGEHRPLHRERHPPVPGCLSPRPQRSRCRGLARL
ncbi:MAG: hypothetical protein MZU79_08800 [Anaerotruncus sp.]|nr:hypothetical protein [Anaerotruncus sp.]